MRCVWWHHRGGKKSPKQHWNSSLSEIHRETRSLTLFHEAQCWAGEHLQEPAVEGNPELCSMTTSEAHEGQLRHRLQGPLHSRPLGCYKGCPTYREQSAIAMKPWARLVGHRVEDVHKLRALQTSMDTLWHSHTCRWQRLTGLLTIGDALEIIYSAHGYTDGYKCRLGGEAANRLLLHNNFNYGELIMLWNITGKNKPTLMKCILHLHLPNSLHNRMVTRTIVHSKTPQK